MARDKPDNGTISDNDPIKRLLDTYGLKWTHIVLLSGVLFSAFSLDAYLNPGLWILGTLAGLWLVYLFRDDVPIGKWTFMLPVIGLTIAALAIPVLVTAWRVDDFTSTAREYRQLTTLYASLVVGTAVGFLTIAQKRRYYRVVDELPDTIDDALTWIYEECPAFNESISYKLRFSRVGEDRLAVEMRVRVVTRNRTREPLPRTAYFCPIGENVRFEEAAIDGIPVPIGERKFSYGRGKQIPYSIGTSSATEVTVRTIAHCGTRDADLFCTYLPAERIEIEIGPLPEGIEVDIQSLLPQDVDPTIEGDGTRTLSYSGGVLPFQGARVLWWPTGGYGTPSEFGIGGTASALPPGRESEDVGPPPA